MPSPLHDKPGAPIIWVYKKALVIRICAPPGCGGRYPAGAPRAPIRPQGSVAVAPVDPELARIEDAHSWDRESRSHRAAHGQREIDVGRWEATRCWPMPPRTRWQNGGSRRRKVECKARDQGERAQSRENSVCGRTGNRGASNACAGLGHTSGGGIGGSSALWLSNSAWVSPHNPSGAISPTAAGRMPGQNRQPGQVRRRG